MQTDKYLVIIFALKVESLSTKGLMFYFGGSKLDLVYCLKWVVFIFNRIESNWSEAKNHETQYRFQADFEIASMKNFD